METTQTDKEKVSGQPITADQPLSEEAAKRLDDWAEKKFGSPEAVVTEVKKEVNVPYLMLQLKMVKMEECEACTGIDNKIAVLRSILDDLNAERTVKAAPFALKTSGLEDQIIQAALNAGRGFMTDHGKVNFRKSYLKRSWSLDELDTACALDTYIKAKIWQFREEKQVKATASVELFL